MKMTIIRNLMMLIGFITAASLQAQNGAVKGGDEILFTVNGQPVTKEEFLYVYKKNNPGKETDFSRQSLQDYLDLYVNFKLKVTEARAIRIDTTEKVREELQKYGDQLIKSNFDKEILDPAAKKLYDKMTKEKLVYHIMIKNEMAKDTAETLKKLNAARERILKGEDLTKVSREVSTDTSNKVNPGVVGWITVGTIPDMDFENMVYSTAKGDVSPIFQSKFGYHFIKVIDERPGQGQTTAAHILIKTPKNATPVEIAKSKLKADSIYNLLKQGADFDEMAVKYSDDKSTATNGGILEPFGTGKMTLAFQEAAYALKNPGDYSPPTKTTYGFHIIQLIEKKPLTSYDEMKEELRGKVERSPEYKILRNDFVARVKATYVFNEYSDAKNDVFALLDSSFVKNNWTMGNAVNMNKTVFSIGNKVFTQADLASYIEMNQRTSREKDMKVKFEKLYTDVLEQTLIEYDLAQRNIDFRRLMQEYRDGIPLFALLEQKVWSMAAKDTLGLEKYYEENKTNYMWAERVEASIYTVTDPLILKAVQKMAKKGKSDKEIMDKFNTDSTVVVTITSNLYLPGQNSNVDNLNKTIGMGENILNADGSTTFVVIKRIVPPTPKTLKEARGYVISNYQDYLEKKWIAELHQKYPVVIYEPVFNSMVR